MLNRHSQIRATLRHATAALALACLLPLATRADTPPTPHCLWKVTRGDATLYLTGSVHLMTTNQYPLATVFEHAYTNSSKLVLEMDLAEAQTREGLTLFTQASLLPKGKQLADLLTPQTQQALLDYCESTSISPILFNHMKPWMALLMLTQLELSRAGFHPQLGLDTHFYERARRDGKPIDGLESLAQQLALLDSLSDQDPDMLVLHGIEELRTLKEQVAALIASWEGGDTAALETLLMESLRTFPTIYQTLIVDRNRRWMKPLLRLLRTDQSTMVVIGAAHVVGKQGLLILLAQRGCTIEQL
jgi:uncharacterized protein YbaP (TraB family)